jgi:hypothetical protein
MSGSQIIDKPIGTPTLADFFPWQAAAGGTGSTQRVTLQNLITAGGAAPATAYDDVLFVGKIGNDSNAGTNPNTPFLTLGQAITAANSLGPAIDNRVLIQVLDNGVYSEDVEQPDHCSITGRYATLYGPLQLGDDAQFDWFRQRATSNSETMVVKPSDHTGTSYCEITEIDGTGPASNAAPGTGTLVNSFCVRNNANAGILFIRSPKIWVSKNGEGIGDSSTGQGHMHARVEDLYLAGDGALGVAANIVNSSIILFFGHIREFGGSFSGTTGIKMGSSGVCVAIGMQIVCNEPYDVTTNSNRSLRLVCPDIQGTPTGTAEIEFSNRRIVAPDLPTSASGLPAGSVWVDTGAGNVLKVVT